jgi:hypothetical protein
VSKRMRRSIARITRLAITILAAALVAWAFFADAHWAERHVLPSYCATNAAEWAIGRAVRWVAAALGVLAVTSMAPALERRVLRVSFRAPAVAGIALAVAASLAVTEVYMRRLHERITHGEQPPLARGGAMTRADPRLGWAYFPGRTTWVQSGDRRIAYAIDADGDRAASSDDLADPDRPSLLFAGESIAFGYGLPHEETIPFLVGHALGVQSVNLAVIGYGNDQAYVRVLDALRRYRQPLAVVTLFVPNQMKRNVDDWRPRLALGPGGALEHVPAAGGPRIAKLLQALPFRGGEALRVTAAILRATADAARARGALPLFVVTNYGPACLRRDSGEAWIVDELFVRQGLPFVRVDLGEEDRLPGLFERHPSAHGARKIAAAVARALSAELGTRLTETIAP